MNNELFKKNLEFTEALETAKNAKKNLIKTAESVLIMACELNNNDPVSFPSTCLENEEEDFIGEFDTVSFDDGDICLSHSECDDAINIYELDNICYRDLQTLIKAVVDAVAEIG